MDLTNLPPYILFILDYLRGRLMARSTIHCSMGRVGIGERVERFRTDAKAEGDDIGIGGWRVDERGTKYSRWFAIKLTRANAPWAFRAGEPFRTIASLELFGTLLCVKLL